MEIRRLPQTCWKDFRELRLEALELSPLAFGNAPSEEAHLRESYWRRMMKGAVFAIEDGRPVGMIVCSFNRTVKFEHIAEIHGFYVRAGHRGKGVGTALLQHAVMIARRKGTIEKVRLYVNTRQRAALRMYVREGFHATGTFRREMKVGRRFYTMLAMEKGLRSLARTPPSPRK